MIFLRELFAFIAILWIIRQLARLLLPMLFQGMVNKATRQHSGGQQSGGQQQRKQSTRTDGAIRVDFIPPKDREAKAADKAGDFIDYEEIR